MISTAVSIAAFASLPTCAFGPVIGYSAPITTSSAARAAPPPIASTNAAIAIITRCIGSPLGRCRTDIGRQRPVKQSAEAGGQKRQSRADQPEQDSGADRDEPIAGGQPASRHPSGGDRHEQRTNAHRKLELRPG